MSQNNPRRPVARWPRAASAYAPSAQAAAREIYRTRLRRYHRHRTNVFILLLALSLALGAAAWYFGFQVVIARGGGMSPAIEGGSVVLCVRQSALNGLYGIIPEEVRRVDRNDLALIDCRDADKPENHALLLRRVIALGGDRLDEAGGELILNRDVVVGDAGATDLVYPVTVPAGSLFVAGDQRSLAIDSRMRAFGAVSESDVAARPIAILWPVYAIGPVN